MTGLGFEVANGESNGKASGKLAAQLVSGLRIYNCAWKRKSTMKKGQGASRRINLVSVKIFSIEPQIRNPHTPVVILVSPSRFLG